jgi:hypothetical protein
VKTYIRFEDGQQVEATILATKPAGDSGSSAAIWKTAPKNFDFSKRYRLNGSGTIEEISSEELFAEQLSTEKIHASQELKRLINNVVGKYIGENQSKQKSYELQEKAANGVIDNPDSPFATLIQPLAKIRDITVLEMAELILEKAAIANQKIIQAEAIEDQYQDLLQNAGSSNELVALIAEAKSKLENF